MATPKKKEIKKNVVEEVTLDALNIEELPKKITKPQSFHKKMEDDGEEDLNMWSPPKNSNKFDDGDDEADIDNEEKETFGEIEEDEVLFREK